MQFAHPLPWWLAVALAAGIALSTFVAYRRPLAPLTRTRRALLVGLRVATLSALVLFLFRPVILLPPANARGAIVPVLVDVSRSMRLLDGGTDSRLARAVSLVKSQLLPALSSHYEVVVQQVGDGVTPANIDGLRAEARRSDLAASLDEVREHYRGQRVAGIVVVSDGGDTSQPSARTAGEGPFDADQGRVPVFAIGVGAVEGQRDREVVGAAVGDPRLNQASVDLRVSVTSAGFGREPFQLRLLANGVLSDTRRIVPHADDSPVDEVFTVSPDPLTPTVYTVEIPSANGEEVAENNSRSVLVNPVGRRRRLLMVEGAPGFEHSFLKRALAVDPSLEVDSVTRKGKNADGKDTFIVQGGAGRAAALIAGFPTKREDLYAYDAIVIANVEGDFFTRAQLSMTADFVSERGGGLLVMGGRSFLQQGLMATPLEIALPVELNERRAMRASLAGASLQLNKLVVTPEGENHPIMRLADTPDQTRRLWTALPALAASAPLGAPRPGASVLAVAAAAGGVAPIIAVQRFGQGRSMVFAGEASWRWKMMLASHDRTYELFWRHAVRWLAGPAPDPLSIVVSDAPEPGDAAGIDIDARDAAFAPVPNAVVEATLTTPGGATEALKLRKDDPAGSRFTTPFHPEQTGLYRVSADAQQGAASLGAAERWIYVGGADREFADPRLNEGFLDRIARASGGRYVRAADASQVVTLLQSGISQAAAPQQRDLWHEPWAFALIVGLLAGEWTMRRRWGLR